MQQIRHDNRIDCQLWPGYRGAGPHSIATTDTGGHGPEYCSTWEHTGAAPYWGSGAQLGEGYTAGPASYRGSGAQEASQD